MDSGQCIEVNPWCVNGYEGPQLALLSMKPTVHHLSSDTDIWALWTSPISYQKVIIM